MNLNAYQMKMNLNAYQIKMNLNKTNEPERISVLEKLLVSTVNV